MKTPLGTDYGSRYRRRPHCIRRVPSAPRKGHSTPPPLGPCLLWPRSPISATAELLLHSSPHCVQPIPLKIAHFRAHLDLDPTWFPGPTRVFNPNGSIEPFLRGWVVWLTDRQTDRPRYSVCNNSPHLRRLRTTAMRPNINAVAGPIYFPLNVYQAFSCFIWTNSKLNDLWFPKVPVRRCNLRRSWCEIANRTFVASFIFGCKRGTPGWMEYFIRRMRANWLSSRNHAR